MLSLSKLPPNNLSKQDVGVTIMLRIEKWNPPLYFSPYMMVMQLPRCHNLVWNIFAHCATFYTTVRIIALIILNGIMSLIISHKKDLVVLKQSMFTMFTLCNLYAKLSSKVFSALRESLVRCEANINSYPHI